MKTTKYSISIKNDDIQIASLVLYTVTLRSRKLACIEEVKTHEDHRNKGHATRLIKIAIEQARTLGADVIELCTRYPEFYTRCGFTEDGNVRMRFGLNSGHVIKW